MDNHTDELLASLHALNKLLKEVIKNLDQGSEDNRHEALPLAEYFLEHEANLNYQSLINELGERMN